VKPSLNLKPEQAGVHALDGQLARLVAGGLCIELMEEVKEGLDLHDL
jgi:hypothetical protein